MADRVTDVTSHSRLYISPAFPPGAGPDYVNAVVQVKTRLRPEAFLDRLHEIEAAFGRQRRERWSARVLDLDLLSLDDCVRPDARTFAHWSGLPLEKQKTTTPDRLILPHPRLQERAFVLVPLAEIAPDWRHPVTGRTARQMRDALDPSDLASVRPV